jgi:hypothetical protein
MRRRRKEEDGERGGGNRRGGGGMRRKKRGCATVSEFPQLLLVSSCGLWIVVVAVLSCC